MDFFTRNAYLRMNGSIEYSLDQMYTDETLTDLQDTNMLVRGSLNNVELSTSSQSYYPIKRISIKERRVGFGYYTRDKYIGINPLLVSGQARITYTRKLDTLDKRRGTITADTSGVSIVLGVGTVTADTTFAVGYISVVDSNGTPIKQNIAVTSYDSGTRTISTATTWTTPLTGYFVVYGKYATDVSGLDDICEKYLVDYVMLQVAIRDSSGDRSAYASVLEKMEDELLKLYADNNADANYIPILSSDYLNW